ncbi:hypothetical protein N7532_011206 [Penicillium argentinense]|uniref:Small ribosomal subunit protein mS29 n=1 Tax=Penicillium argentinense TaxID=1131581 RepID=A0A9W9EHZ7_9EURO|nr:uncharacterized protein N7532_011206 [Penicillium argentinense]KAJ5082163.1 hypothetical protein N7532_011206 [Penicillium argentinense]
MASAWCWSCLSRLRPTPRAVLNPPSAIPRLTSAPFHSSAVQYAPPLKKKSNSMTQLKYRQGQTLRRKKKKHVEKARPPAPGERKALRKRIVLSNPNALEVDGMQELSAETMIDARLRGSVLGLPVPMLDQLRAVQAFKPKQGWSIFRRPGTIMRRDTLEMGRAFDKITGGDAPEKGKVIKKVLTGMKGSGKTVHLLQAMAMGFLKKWVVITIPEARDLVSGDTAYVPVEGTKPTQYIQPGATSDLLKRTVEANREVLSGLKVSQKHAGLSGLKPTSTLEDLAKLGFQDPAVAWPVFQALWTELTATAAAPGMEKDFQPRPPMLVALDGLAHWMQDSAYRDIDFKLIHAHDLVFVKHFLSLLREGQASMKNGGMVLYSTSTSNNPSIYALEVGLDQLAARQAGISPTSADYPSAEAYSNADPRVLEFFKPIEGKEPQMELQTLGGLTREETRGYLEYFARSGLLREPVNDHWVGEKWSMSGGGIIGELEKLGRHVRNTAIPTPQTN